MNKLFILLSVTIAATLLGISYHTQEQYSYIPHEFQEYAEFHTDLPDTDNSILYKDYSPQKMKEIVDFYNSGAIDKELRFLKNVTGGKIHKHADKSEISLNQDSANKLARIFQAKEQVSRLSLGGVKFCIFEPTYTFSFYMETQDITATVCFDCDDVQLHFKKGEKSYVSGMHTITNDLEKSLLAFIEEQKSKINHRQP